MFTGFREAAPRKPRRERPSTTRPRGRVDLRVESLEDRKVPTVLFMPFFKPEAIAAGSTNDGLKSPVVNIIFQGNYWIGANGVADKPNILADFKSIVGGPYLSGLTQYGSDGKAMITAKPDTTTQAINLDALANLPFSPGDLDYFIQHQISKGLIAAPGGQPAIYLVVTSPGTTSTLGFGGFNTPSTGLHEVWASTSFDSTGHISIDNLTDVFSHELVETISDPDPSGVTVTLPSNLPSYLVPTGTLQIGDGEPDGARYQYRLGGVLVQAYWSKNDGAYIVPDGDRQKFTVNAEWTSTGNFVGKYNLSLAGDQLGANYSDSFVIGIGGSAAHPQTLVGENNEAVGFDTGLLASIYVDTVGGSNWVDITGLESQTTLSLQSTGRGSQDHVVVGSAGSLSAVLGIVNVANSSGTTNLEVDDATDTAAHPAKLTTSTYLLGTTATTNSTIAFSGLGTINYSSSGPAGASTGTGGVTALRVDLPIGSFADSLDVEGVSNFAPVTVVGRTFDSITGPAASKIKKILF